MLVMPANQCGSHFRALHARFPNHVGHLYSPGGQRTPFCSYALDNGRFACWSKGVEWDEAGWRRMLATHAAAARWVLVPDIVADRSATLREWDRWAPQLAGLPLAIAVQDGMTAADVPPAASIVFVGGSKEWKWRSLPAWCDAFPRIHVGRVNSPERLLECDAMGVESVDGTGWYRGDSRQLAGLVDYLERAATGSPPRQRRLF